jgi:ketosteroid isomerase-like protein
LRNRLVVLLMGLALLVFAGCRGQWVNNAGGGQGGGQGRNRPHATEDETRQAFEKVMSAIAHKDIASLNDMMSPTTIFIDPSAGPKIFVWEEAKPIIEKSFATSVNFQLSNESGYRIGVERDLGWIATVYHVRVPNDKGEVAQSDGGMSMLFQKTDNGYKLLMLHASRFTAATPAADKLPQGAPAAKAPAAKKK